jgi:hypothetical protein
MGMYQVSGKYQLAEGRGLVSSERDSFRETASERQLQRDSFRETVPERGRQRQTHTLEETGNDDRLD